VTRTNLTSGNDVASRSSYSTAGITPIADNLLLAFVLNASAGFVPPTPAVPMATGNGLTWEVVDSGITGHHRLTCLRAMRLGAAPSPGALTFGFSGQPQALCAWSVFEYDNVDLSGANGAGAVVQHPSGTAAAATGLTVPLGPFGDPATNLAVGAIGLTAVHPITKGPGYTEIDVQSPNTGFGQSATLQSQDRTGAAASVEWAWSGGAGNAVAIALEVKAAAVPIAPAPGPSDSAEQLARKFEPILFFDRSEAFFPSDAKRYVENAALWIAEAPPFDAKASWGGSTGQPFPRTPAVPTGGIHTEDDGKPDYIGAPGNQDSEQTEHFLEFGGWIDKSNVAQPQVTAISSNDFADRGAIHDRYTNEPKLADSQFWYHAELFDTARLRRLAATVPAPDLLKVVDTFTNPALLCYYFFFPAHEQQLEAACTNIEATEFGTYAGEWGAVTLTLERDDAHQEYHPSFVGFTGSRTPLFQDSSGNPVRHPQAFDDERRGSLKVEQWRSAGGVQVPELTEGHPMFFVSRGTHSLYLDPGPHPVDPYPDDVAPSGCGLGPGSTPAIVGDTTPSTAVTLLKLIIGGILGFFAWIPEEVGHHGELAITQIDTVPDDQAPATGMGRVVHPVGVVVPNAGTDPQPWRSAQGATIDGRSYDFLVDRTHQGWWPSDDTRSGYRGRWGQQVENNPDSLRAGMRFPPFWKMFLLAVEDGRSTKQLP
jgi:hypothetical protein